MQALRGERLWQALESDDRQMTRRLMVSALTRSHNLPVEGGYPTSRVSYEWARAALPDTLGYLIFLTGIRDFNYAGYLADKDEILSCQMYLPMPTHGSTTADFFNPLTRHIEDLVLDGRAAYPVERTLLTSGMVIGGVDSLHADGAMVDTPEMEVVYRAPRESTFWRV